MAATACRAALAARPAPGFGRGRRWFASGVFFSVLDRAGILLRRVLRPFGFSLLSPVMQRFMAYFAHALLHPLFDIVGRGAMTERLVHLVDQRMNGFG